MESFRTDTGALPLAQTSDHSFSGGSQQWPWVTFKKSRVRESRMLGSVRAKAEWLSYSTIPRASPAMLGMEAIGSIALMPLLQLVVVRPGHPGFSARGAHVPELRGPLEQPKPQGVYPVFEGHCSPSQVAVCKQQPRRSTPVALLASHSKVSRPLRHSSY